MIQRIKSIKPIKNYILEADFDDGRRVLYDVNNDIETLPGYDNLKNIHGLFEE